MDIEKNSLNVPYSTAVRTPETLQRPDARRPGLAGREVQLRAEQRAYVAREYPGVSVGEFDKLQGVLKNRSPDEIAKMLANLNRLGQAGIQQQRSERYRGTEGYIGGVDSRQLEALNTLFPNESINSLCVCLLKAPNLKPQKLFNLCKIYPTKDPEGLSHLTDVFTDEAVANAIQQNATFSDAKINAKHVAEALKRIPQLSIKGLSALCEDNAEMSSSDVVDRAQLRFLFPGAEPQMISGALENFYIGTDSTFEEFVVLASNGLISRGEGPDSLSSAIAECQQYRNRLKVLAPAAEPWLVSETLHNISKIEKASFVEFEKLINDRILGEGPLPFVVDQYRQYKANLPHLKAFFPRADSLMIDSALRELNGIRNSSLNEFAILIGKGIVPSGDDSNSLPIAVAQYRQYKYTRRLREFFPDASSQELSTALQVLNSIPNSNFDEFLNRIRNQGDPQVAVNEYHKYKSDWSQLKDRFPDAESWQISKALEHLDEVPFASIKELVELIDNNTASRWDGDLFAAVTLYLKYKDRFEFLQERFPDADRDVISGVLQDLNGIPRSEFGEFMHFHSRSGGPNPRDPMVAVARYRQYKECWTQLNDLFPGETKHNISYARDKFITIRNSSFEEFVRLLKDNTLSRGILNSPINVVRDYEAYKERLAGFERSYRVAMRLSPSMFRFFTRLAVRRAMRRHRQTGDG